MNFTLAWHPQFSIEDANQDHVLFLGTDKQFTVPRSDFEMIDPFVKQGKKLSDYVFATPDFLTNVKSAEQIDKLVDQGILRSNREEQATYKVPSYSGDPEIFTVGDHEIYVLTDLVSRDRFGESLLNLNISTNIRLVITDDYQDERLTSLAREFAGRNISWIPCQITGKAPMVGPWIKHEDTFAALVKRLKQNQPVRTWASRQSGKTVKLPVLYNPDLQEQVLQEFCTRYLTKEHLDKYADKLFAYSPGGKSSYLPAPRKYRDHKNKVDSGGAYKKTTDEDGGYRLLSRRETLEKILPEINPVTGILAEFKELTPAGRTETNLPVFQAAYFQNSYLPEALSADTFVQLALGKGVLPEQALASALGEALERQAAQYNGEEKAVYGSPKSLDQRAVLPQQLNPFSEKQYQAFAALPGKSLEHPQWVCRYKGVEPMHWVRGWSCTYEEPVYLPFAHCYANTPYEDQHYAMYSHNGNAAGNSYHESVLQGTLELVERDAVAIWWYNEIRRPGISLEVVPAKQRQIIENTLAAEWNFWLLDLTTDVNFAATVTAVGQHKETGKFVMGYGAHLDVSIASSRALTEMYQLIMIKDKVTGPFDFEAIPEKNFLFPSQRIPQKTLADYTLKNFGGDLNKILAFTIEQLKIHDLEMIVLDYTRDDNPLHTTKTIIPGLCHMWPQLANERLYQVPVKMKWLPFALEEDELNPMDLYL